ncbi:hypothetical protein ABID16_003092 [Rhizobium aquaticum]|uniref:MobA/VirD2-like nuclease domain-containing protein n=1 Tax=Rhizobium aquaticum TaxID=1549636 RepID=A0ABV2J1W9_9HYPH
MIVQSTRISRTGGVRYIERHLLDKPGDNDKIVVLVGDRVALHDALALANLKACKYALRHLSISPERPLDKADLSDFLKSIDAEFKIGPDRPRLLVMHEKKGRQHFHFAVAEVDPATMKVLSCRNDFARLEKLARHHEQIRDETVQPTRAERRSKKIEGFSDVARKRAERKVEAFDRTKLKMAFEQGVAAFFRELKLQDLTIAPGEKGFILVAPDGEFVAAANRAAGVRRAVFTSFMRETKNHENLDIDKPRPGRDAADDRSTHKATAAAAGLVGDARGRRRDNGAFQAVGPHSRHARATDTRLEKHRWQTRAAIAPIGLDAKRRDFHLRRSLENLHKFDFQDLLRRALEMAQMIRSIFEPVLSRYARQIEHLQTSSGKIAPADAPASRSMRYDLKWRTGHERP